MRIWSSILVITGFEPAITRPKMPNSEKTMISQAMTVSETGRFSIVYSPLVGRRLARPAPLARAVCRAEGVVCRADCSGALAGLGEELGFLLTADALGYLGGIVGGNRVAAPVRQAQVLERGVFGLHAEPDRLRARALVVSRR